MSYDTVDKVPVFKMEVATGRAACRGENCSKNADWITPKGKIKKGTPCAVVSIQTSLIKGCLYQYFYCKECTTWLIREANKHFNITAW